MSSLENPTRAHTDQRQMFTARFATCLLYRFVIYVDCICSVMRLDVGETVTILALHPSHKLRKLEKGY